MYSRPAHIEDSGAAQIMMILCKVNDSIDSKRALIYHSCIEFIIIILQTVYRLA